MPGRRFTTVLFDLDNTLCDYWGSSRQALTAAFELVAERYPDLDRDELRRDYFRVQREAEERERANGPVVMLSLTRRGRFAAALARHGITDNELAADLTDIYEERLVLGLELFPEAPAVLDELGPQYVLGLLTNGAGTMQRRKLAHLGIEERFRHTVISEEVGFAKPDPRMFHLALELASARPDETLFVGDTLDLDVAGARAAGVTAVWLNRRGRDLDPAYPAPDYIVADLLQMLPLLAAPVPALERADGD